MDVVHARCAGIDVHKKSVTVCVAVRQERGQVAKETRVFPTNTSGLLALDDWLTEQGVTAVAMESTGVYWRPVHAILEEGRELLLVNAQHYHPPKGKKTDRAAWAAARELRPPGAGAGAARSGALPPEPGG